MRDSPHIWCVAPDPLPDPPPSVVHFGGQNKMLVTSSSGISQTESKLRHVSRDNTMTDFVPNFLPGPSLEMRWQI